VHFGIDYGSKLAGTTVITYEQNNSLHQISSDKKQDADKLILDSAIAQQPDNIYIDAPLSLPAAYFGKGDNYHYRSADKELSAMSPMFLGGLTARAMALKAKLVAIDISVYETYPGAYVRSNAALKEVYSKKDVKCIPACIEALDPLIPFDFPTIETTHQLDSLIAWFGGYRHISHEAVVVGYKDEGVIIY